MVDDRRVAIFGLILFVIGAVIFFNVDATKLYLVLPTEVLLVLGWGLTFAIAMRRSRENYLVPVVIVLLLFAFSTFYFATSHEVHMVSGIGFGLPHEPPTGHVMIGFILFVITMAITSALALRRSQVQSMQQAKQ